jgi:hypothetical protein
MTDGGAREDSFSLSRRAAGIAALSLFFFGALFTLYQKACEPAPGLFAYDPGAAAPGYVLVSPYRSGNLYEGEGEVLLLDARGNVAHRWRTAHPALEAKLSESGSLFVAMTPPIDLASYPSVGTTGILQELDWDGNVVWEYEDGPMTHDFELMPDGSIAYLRWSEAPAWFAQGVQGGMRTATTSVWTNEVVVVDRDKNIVWTWAAHEHLSPAHYVLNPFVPRADWAHVNSIRYVAENPLTHTPAFLISARHVSTVFLVDITTKEVIWESPKGMFSLQHDATLTENGTILVFDNGLFRPGGPPALLSRAIEVDPRTNEIVWSYNGGPGGQALFSSSIAGGAQRLKNGNTLMTVSTAGVVEEVTREGALAWELRDSFRDDAGAGRLVFKARKYNPDGTAWKRLLPASLPHAFCFAR